MNQYLLSTFRTDGEVPGHPETPEEMQAFMRRVLELEDDMEKAGAFVFGGALLPANKSAVIDPSGSRHDGAYVEAKSELAGFYIVNAADDAEAQMWADRTAEATNHPIEIRPFMATGRMKDQMPQDGTP